jgi:hypothetical protein
MAMQSEVAFAEALGTLVGRYKNAHGEELIVENSDNGKGVFLGTLTFTEAGEKLTGRVQGEFHFLHGIVYTLTIISFMAFWAGDNTDRNKPNFGEAWVGMTDARTFESLEVRGQRCILNPDGSHTIKELRDVFVRQP